MENPPITTELMRFYTVRNPKPVTTQQVQDKYVQLSASIAGNSALISALNLILAGTDSAEDKLQAVQSEVQGFVDSDLYVNSVPQWEGIFATAGAVRDVVNSNSPDWESEVHKLLVPYITSGEGVPESIVQQAWENLIVYNLIGARNEVIQYATDILRIANLVADMLAERAALPEAKWRLQTDVLLPKTIFPLPRPQTESGGGEQEQYREIEHLTADFATAQKAADLIENIDTALRDLRQKEQQAMEAMRWKYRNAKPMEFDNCGNPIFPPKSNLAEDIKNTGILTTEIYDQLSETTQGVLDRHLVTPGQDSFSYVLQLLEADKRDLGLLISQKLNLTQTVYAAAGSIVLAPSKAQLVLSALQTETAPAFPSLIPGGSLIEVEQSTNEKIDIEMNPADTVFTGCKVKPLGIADLRRVEQKLICNVPGEIAHIENILKAEAKERATRRLNRVEETMLTSYEREAQEERDTITTDRFQLEKATSKVVDQQQSFEVGVTVNAHYGFQGGGVSINASSGYSSATSTSESDQQAIAYAQEVTEKARQMVVEKTYTEQTRKVIDEFEETNKHLLDNTSGNTHVVGIYRWVDKIYEAQVVNYGKRLMFEMMIPDPAAFHRYAMAGGKIADAVTIPKPLDPINDIAAIRQIFSGISPLKSAADITEANYMLWAGLYHADVEAPPPFEITIGMAKSATNFPNNGQQLGNLATNELEIPEGYTAYLATAQSLQGYSAGNTGWLHWACGKVASMTYFHWGQSGPFVMDGEQGQVPFTVTGRMESFTLSLTLKCRRTQAYLDAWQLKTYTAIKTAYDTLLNAYRMALAEAQTRMDEGLLRKNPMLNRAIEQTELRKHAVRMLSQCQFGPSEAMKADFPNDSVGYPDFNCCEAADDGKLVQFIENCFEFGLMSYNFYPYFWSRKSEWKTIYRLEDADPIFTQFLQAGYARVIVPVRVGFEKAALRYVADGTIWNGGPPSINDPYYVSLIAQLADPVGTVEGDPWQIRIPSSLTILQKDADGINESGLPCNPAGL